MKILISALLVCVLLFVLPARSQGLIGVLSTLDVHATVGFSASINRQALVAPSWGVNLVTYDRFGAGAGFTRSGFGPFLSFRLVWIVNAQGQWNGMLWNNTQGEPRFSAGIFIPL